MIELERVENLSGDLDAIRTRLNECRNEAQEITATVKSRILSDKENAERRAEELQKEIDNGSCSDAAARIKQREIDAIRSRRYEPASGEREEFETAISAYKAALNDLRRKQDELKDAVTAACRRLEAIRSDAFRGADAVLIERYISSEIEAFKKLSEYGEAVK